MPEILLHYIWQHGLFLPFEQTTTDGRSIQVLATGQHNTNAGPDFTNVHLLINGVELVGNIEIHIASSDWYRHRHHLDHAYDSVLLHVVRRADKEVFNSHGQPIPQLVLHYPDDHDYLQQLIIDATSMDSALYTHPCAQHLLRQPSLLTEGWKRTMLLRRLDCKQRNIEQLLTYFTNDYAQAMYITLAHHFGFHINGIPMEMLAMRTPLSILRKHHDNLFQLTALLLGQAGMLGVRDKDDTVITDFSDLQREYTFLRGKYNLSPIDSALWKHSRLRPQNAPHIRVRQLAQLLYQSDFFFSQALDATTIDAMCQLFSLSPSFSSSSTFNPLGSSSVTSLIINVILPYQYVAGKHEQVLHFLEELPAENNAIIRQWVSLGQTVHSAADTQALIHLYQSCCQSSHCINCDVAYQIFRSHDLQSLQTS